MRIAKFGKFIISRVCNGANATCRFVRANTFQSLSLSRSSGDMLNIKRFSLLSKFQHEPIQKFNHRVITQIPKNATNFSTATIGKSGNPYYRKEIITFYDKNNNIIQRIIRESDKDDILKTYQNTTRELDEFEKSLNIKPPKDRIVTTYICKPQFLAQRDQNGLLLSAKYEKQDILKEELIEAQKKLYNDSIKIEGVKDTSSKGVTVTRIQREYKPNSKFPSNIKVSENYKYKEITIDEQDNISLVLEDHIDKSGLEFSLIGKNLENLKIKSIESFGDAYIAKTLENNPIAQFLYIRFPQKAQAITDYFLKDKGLGKLGVKVFTDSKKVGKNAAAHFSSVNEGEIHFKKGHFSIPTAAHEVEHAYQHSLIGRLGNARNSFELKAKKSLKTRLTPQQQKDAKIYFQASLEYPNNLESITDLTKYHPYWDNELEVKAREAAKNISTKMKFIEFLPGWDIMKKLEF